MSNKTFAIVTDIHANEASLQTALAIIGKRRDIDQTICLGDCFTLGPDPVEVLHLLSAIENCIFIRGNHDRYLIEKLWEHEHPSLEGMDPDDPLCQAIVANNQWSAEQIGAAGISFLREMHVAHREVVENMLVEFTHAWYERDDQPPTMPESLNWRKHVKRVNPDLDKFIFVHGHTHVPRVETKEDLTILCQGSTGLPFDEDQRGAVAFLTIGDEFKWDVQRYDYAVGITLKSLQTKQPPFFRNLTNTLKYATIRNDL
ncbi:MAG: metallophosphoesterase family protein [Candidatus Neomarinimicrobiota bacterium]